MQTVFVVLFFECVYPEGLPYGVKVFITRTAAAEYIKEMQNGPEEYPSQYDYPSIMEAEIDL